MHELSICRNIIKTIERQQQIKKFAKVELINLSVGELSCVDQANLAFYFNLIKKDTYAEQAKLQIHSIPGKAFCQCCKQAFFVEQRMQTCPNCGELSNNLLQGDSIIINSIEVN